MIPSWSQTELGPIPNRVQRQFQEDLRPVPNRSHPSTETISTPTPKRSPTNPKPIPHQSQTDVKKSPKCHRPITNRCQMIPDRYQNPPGTLEDIREKALFNAQSAFRRSGNGIAVGCGSCNCLHCVVILVLADCLEWCALSLQTDSFESSGCLLSGCFGGQE